MSLIFSNNSARSLGAAYSSGTRSKAIFRSFWIAYRSKVGLELVVEYKKPRVAGLLSDQRAKINPTQIDHIARLLMDAGLGLFAFEVIQNGFGNDQSDLIAVVVLNHGFSVRVKALQILDANLALEHASCKVTVNLEAVVDQHG